MCRLVRCDNYVPTIFFLLQIISKALKKQYMTETKTPESKKVSHIHFSEDDDIPSDMS